jgi:hypothetical protein
LKRKNCTDLSLWLFLVWSWRANTLSQVLLPTCPKYVFY